MDVGVKGSSDSDGPAGSVGDGVDDFRPHPNNWNKSIQPNGCCESRWAEIGRSESCLLMSGRTSRKLHGTRFAFVQKEEGKNLVSDQT